MLGEDIRDDVFDGDDTIKQIQALIESDPEMVAFNLDVHSDLVDVYYKWELLYKINRPLYYKLTADDDDHANSLKDCSL